MIEGPRPVAPGEFDSLLTMVNHVFRHDRPAGPTLLDEYPHLFAHDNLSNLRVVCKDGRVVSHVGTTIRNAVILGCSVRVANVGAVSTHPDHRGQGYAGACFRDACDNARSQGVDFMLISGDRKLYRMAGCRPVGLHTMYTLAADDARALQADISVSRYQAGDRDAIKALFENEPVRHLRPLEEWDRFIRNGRSTHGHAALWLMRRQDQVAAYAAVMGKSADGRAVVQEYAGDRSAIAASAYELMRANGLTALGFHVPEYDVAMRSHFKGRTLSQAVNSGGTRLILQFEQLMDRLRPLFEERVGSMAASDLSFREEDGVLEFGYQGAAVVSTDRGGASQLIFGTRETPEWKWAGESPGKDVLTQIFPAPSLLYGFSYV